MKILYYENLEQYSMIISIFAISMLGTQERAE